MDTESTQEFNCIFCKESFENKEELQIHFRKHGDPRFNQSIKNKSRSTNDSQTCADNNEEGERVSCDVCSDVFPTISKAITHKHKMHPDHDAKYFCPWCGKLFTMKHLYNKHIQTTHNTMEESEKQGFHCDYCDVDFFVASAMVYHNKFFHRQDTELAAIGHSKKLKLFNQELLQMYYCPFCGEEYCNKVNLHKHMGDDHIDEDQSPDDVLRCPLCDAIFYHLDAYELHLTFHSSKDKYSEENEMANEITEFSLETVPPIMEKVENDTQDEGESSSKMGIEDLLQQAMNETNDGSNSDVPRKKSKKHKKHKKSKKAAITLDEFLNMNQDVFGEGIDFQGIEVVPEQVVHKQLKGRKVPLKPKAKRKMSTDIAKLKKQGIVVKKKSGKKNINVSGVIPGTPVKIAQNLLQNKSLVTHTKATTSDEVLSKLLNQGNSQIKIVKRSTQDSTSTEEQYPPEVKDKEDICDKKKEDKDTRTSNEEGDVGDNHEDHMHNALAKISNRTEEPNISSDAKTTGDKHTIEQSCGSKVFSNSDNDDSLLRDMHENKTDKNEDHNLTNKSTLETAKSNITNPLATLLNINQHLTVKSLTSSNNGQNKHDTISTAKSSKSDGENDEYNDFGHKVNTADMKSISDTKENNENKNSLNALKHLSHLITIKSVNKNVPVAHNDTKEEMEKVSAVEDDNNSEYDFPEEQETPKQINKKVNDATNEQPQDNEMSKPLEALKNISKNITIKSVSQKTDNVFGKFKSNDSLEDIHEDHDEDIDSDLARKEDTKKFIGNKFNTKSASLQDIENPESQARSMSPSPKFNKSAPQSESKIAEKPFHLKDENKESCSSILKRLPDLTTKALIVGKNISQNVTVKSATHSLNLKGSVIKKSVSKKIDANIEIFNIDDSEDEEENSRSSAINQTNIKPSIETLVNVIKTDINKPIDALKNVSKAVIVKSTCSQNILSKEMVSKVDDVADDYDANSNNSDHDDEFSIAMNKNIQKKDSMEMACPLKGTVGKICNTNINKSMDVLKTLSKNITIKSSIQQKLPVSENASSAGDLPDDYDTHSNYSDGEVATQNDLKQTIKKPKFQNNLSSSTNIEKNYAKTSIDALKNLSKHVTIKSNHQKIPKNENVSTQDDDHSDEDANLLKQNIQPTKSLGKVDTGTKIVVMNESKNFLDKSQEALKNLSKHITIKSTNQQNKNASDEMSEKMDFEDYNYSDGEVAVAKNDCKKNIQKQTQRKNLIGTCMKSSQNFYKSEVHKSEVFKNLSKHVTVKSSTQQKLVVSKNTCSSENMLDLDAHSNDSDNEILRKSEENRMLHQKLQCLNKNLTVKSRNSSPTINVKAQSVQRFKQNLLDGYDSDSNSGLGNVKITEMSEDNVDAEAMSQMKNTENYQSDINCTVQSPSGSNSDDDDYNEQSPDIEKQIKTHKVKNYPIDSSRLKKSDYMDSLKNISKQITVKSQKHNASEENVVETDSNIPKDLPTVPHLNKELSIKTFIQNRPSCRDDNETVTSRTKNLSAKNQKTIASDQLNKVNKEVTVKTFQTETYIEEVTTTVTKTIRTVNQTMQQEVRNTSHVSSVPMIRPQRTPGIRMNQQKNLQGTPVRQIVPTMGQRVRHATPIRPAVGARGIRPTNQIVPARPSNQQGPAQLSNQLSTRPCLVRPSNPRLPVMKKIPTATSNPQKPIVGKQLKISPNAQMQPPKRPAENSTGHFSCFKKPKESLIPVSDIPMFNSKQDSGTTAQYASSSNMTKTNFTTSTTKIVKGNSAVTSTQVKSETSSSSEQLSRLSSMSGLKIMKTCQTKQASNVEEKGEISASKRTALEAIQKLQKSGLLVKKPRLEERYSDNSNSDGDDNFET